MNNIKLALIVTVVFLLSSCGLVNQSNQFKVATDRDIISVKSPIPESGSVMLFMKDSVEARDYRRLDFTY